MPPPPAPVVQRPAVVPPPPRPTPPAPELASPQVEVDAMLSELNAAPPPATPPAPPPAAPDVLELTEEMTAPEPESDIFRTIDGQSDLVFEDRPIEPEPPAIGNPHKRMDGAESRLISSATSAAVDSAFNTLAQTVLVQNARTLEDLVREMLRPMLKTWLDDNLPGLVERMVRAEIERVSRGRS
jgi:cell pole-organizing protein PopZ